MDGTTRNLVGIPINQLGFHAKEHFGVFLCSTIEPYLPNVHSGSERSAFCRAVARGGLYTCEGVAVSHERLVLGDGLGIRWRSGAKGGHFSDPGPFVWGEYLSTLHPSSSEDVMTSRWLGRDNHPKISPNALSSGSSTILNHYFESFFNHSLSITQATIQEVIKNKLVKGQSSQKTDLNC